LVAAGDGKRVLLTDVNTLTLMDGKMTTGRRR
jgi:hypothetical protein